MIGLIDGDVIAFMACPPRVERNPKTGAILLDEFGRRIPKIFTPEEEAAYIEEAWGNFCNKLNNIVEKLYLDDVFIALSGVRNFRQDLFDEYKVHRRASSVVPNHTVPIIRQRAVERGYAIQAVGYEADDLLGIWAREAREAGQKHIICSIDKDLLCIPGLHYLMHKDKEQIVEVSEDEAKRHYYGQLLQGDPTDNIPGVPGIGPKKADKIIAGCATEEEMQEAVLEAYFGAYVADEWLQAFYANAKLIHILSHPDDYFKGEGWKGLI